MLGRGGEYVSTVTRAQVDGHTGVTIDQASKAVGVDLADAVTSNNPDHGRNVTCVPVGV